MQTETYATLTPNATANKHWFEIWNIEEDGSLKNCINFYDAALKDATAWVTQCVNQEIWRTEDVYSVIHATRDVDGTMTRSIIASSEVKLFNVLSKFKENLSFN
jgi:hypothetical protein